MTQDQIDSLVKASRMFTEMTSFCKNNISVTTPASHDEYKSIANQLWELVEQQYKK